ncbi:hypothetical protein OE88DRAFT_1659879 [Heliocybe sulcata]|uniref:Uncharacterized protein n=1 Tax=Heliocybe sulcata TaxID=5364 RepID=A0A5C3MZM9_9AGAM|nr:hypothetical protein OE88DRAFT_1659879 [Heliocybe sulcata]
METGTSAHWEQSMSPAFVPILGTCILSPYGTSVACYASFEKKMRTPEARPGR